MTAVPEARIPATAAGQFRVEAMVLSNGAASAATISLDQDVVAEDAALTSGLALANPRVANTMRELVNDFRQYIIDGAQATGPNGITPRVLASVLSSPPIEMRSAASQPSTTAAAPTRQQRRQLRPTTGIGSGDK